MRSQSENFFLELGYSNLHRYLVQHLKYSDDQAYTRAAAAALLKKSPELSEKIEDGSINLSQLNKVGQCLRQELKRGHEVGLEQTQSILNQIENKSGFDTEKVLAVELDFKPQRHQVVKPQSDHSVRTQITFTDRQFEILRKAQDSISHVVPSRDLAEAITYLALCHIRKIEGKAALDENSDHADNQDSTSAEHTSPIVATRSFRETRKRREYISVKVRRALRARARHRCEHVHVESRNRCDSSFQLQVDHVVPWACGGSNDISNLRILCGEHNRSEAIRWGFGQRTEL
jgi:hypothetical protein